MGDSNKSKKVNTFTWSDNDIQLFLESANSFKAKCEYEARSWKSLGLKYEKNYEIFVENYSKSNEGRSMLCLHCTG